MSRSDTEANNIAISLEFDLENLIWQSPTSSPSSIKTIANAVMKLSDHYINHPDGKTPWTEEFCHLAYRYYYLPLNFLRNNRVIEQGLKVDFFSGIDTFIDWGCGPGTASLAISCMKSLKVKRQILIDESLIALQRFSGLHQHLTNPETSTAKSLESYHALKDSTCLVMSYSLTELASGKTSLMKLLPAGWNKFEALMILEPSTHQDGRRLMQLRQDLIDCGYSIWAPCTHQLQCPLLKESKNDWCHDRIAIEAPVTWFDELEQHLPMRNKTITTSYLLARKKKPTFPTRSSSSAPLIGRLVGDSKPENGKTRQLICRWNQREFLTWLHKKIEPQNFPRGELVQIAAFPESYETKANELRLNEPAKLL